MKTGAETEQAARNPRLPAAPQGRSGGKEPALDPPGAAPPCDTLRCTCGLQTCAEELPAGVSPLPAVCHRTPARAVPWDPSSPAPLSHPPSDQAAG